MKANKSKTAIAAVCLATCLVAAAAIHPLPTPPESLFPDRESAQSCQPAGIADEGRRVKMTMTFNATPTNAAQVAWGQDLNGDEDLEPEETMLVLGVDCGVPFVREEVGIGSWRAEFEVCPAGQPNGEATSSSLQNENGDHLSSTFNFNFRQPSAVSNRLTFAKVTTWGNDNPAPTITVEATRPGTSILLR